MAMTDQTDRSSAYPSIYDVQLEAEDAEKIIEKFVDIISERPSSGVEQALVDYVASTIEPVGWNGIWKVKRGWRGLQSDCDFLVEAINVSVSKLEADVRILTVLSGPGVDVTEHVAIAPLVDLYPLSEDDLDEFFVETAVVIEYVRFFYAHIWKPWDDPDDDLEKYASKIPPRVHLYLDMAAGLVDTHTKVKVQRYLQEGQQVRRTLEALKASSGLNNDDPDLELDSADVKQMVRLSMRLEVLSREMDIIENRELRLCMTGDKFINRSPPLRRGDVPAVHIVAAENFTLAQLRLLKIADDVALEFHHSLGHAVVAVQEQDKILLLPGTHTCAGLPWLDKEVSVEGVGDCADTVLIPTDVGDIFVNCWAPLFKLKNVTVKATKHVHYVVMVHSGVVTMENCHIDGSFADFAVVVLSDAELHMTGCKVEAGQVS
ncbi:unnamed protein product, partial [Ixodes hexagonus]